MIAAFFRALVAVVLCIVGMLSCAVGLIIEVLYRAIDWTLMKLRGRL